LRKRANQPIVLRSFLVEKEPCSAGSEDLNHLAGAVVADQQTTIRRHGNRQRMTEAGGEIAYLPVLIRARAGEDDPLNPAADGAADVGAPLRDKGIPRVFGAEFRRLVDGYGVARGVRGENRDRRRNTGAASVQPAVGVTRPAARRGAKG